MRLIERDVTQAELAHVHEGFREYRIEQGNPPSEQRRHTFVAMDGERFVGCASGVTDNKWFYLSDLWVDKAYRCQGLGRALLEKLERRISQDGIHNIYTWTAEFEAPLFYQKQGYAVFVKLENYFATGHSRIGFRKTL
jgi:ribosomal protein S18 acetylase RimI-like enzyme